MSSSDIHIICGRCGCSTMLKWWITPDSFELGDKVPVIHCGNCSVNHYLDEFMDKKEEVLA